MMSHRWPVWKLALLLYVFVVGAVAINLYMIGLLMQAVGLGAITPGWTVILSFPLGIPATWAASIWVRRLLDEADSEAG